VSDFGENKKGIGQRPLIQRGGLLPLFEEGLNHLKKEGGSRKENSHPDKESKKNWGGTSWHEKKDYQPWKEVLLLSDLQPRKKAQMT